MQHAKQKWMMIMKDLLMKVMKKKKRKKKHLAKSFLMYAGDVHLLMTNFYTCKWKDWIIGNFSTKTLCVVYWCYLSSGWRIHSKEKNDKSKNLQDLFLGRIMARQTKLNIGRVTKCFNSIFLTNINLVWHIFTHNIQHFKTFMNYFET